MNSIFVIFCLATLIQNISSAPSSTPKDVTFELKILHNNDMHGRFDETDAQSSACPDEDVAANKCYGGFSRVAYLVKEFRQKEITDPNSPSVLFLNAGDTYSGTVWFTLFKENITAEFLNELAPDAMSLGNHEFDEGVPNLIRFLEKSTVPVLASNLDTTNVPEMDSLMYFKEYEIFEKKSVKIGVIGYVTPETKFLAPSNNLEFEDEITNINRVADELKAIGVNIIIALGHSGYNVDKQIAAQCPLVDIVVGGHTNTFLWNGNKPDLEEVTDKYPFVVERNGKKVPVVQAYAYTKYLGEIDLKFDTNGDLIEFSGNPILLNSQVPKDPIISEMLEKYRPKIDELKNDIIGQTKVFLDGNFLSCRKKECNMGNIIADSMVYANVLNHNASDGYWTDAAIAFIQGGAIRASVDVKNHRGNISVADVYSILPFNSYLTKIDLLGGTIMEALEHSVERYNQTGEAYGEFLQMSGIRVTYNLTHPVKSRVQNVEVLCAKCAVPKYEPIDSKKTYTVLITTFLADGGDDYLMFETGHPDVMTISDFDAFKEYIEKLGIIYPGVEGRVKLLFYGEKAGGAASIFISFGLLVLSMYHILFL